VLQLPATAVLRFEQQHPNTAALPDDPDLPSLTVRRNRHPCPYRLANLYFLSETRSAKIDDQFLDQEVLWPLTLLNPQIRLVTC